MPSPRSSLLLASVLAASLLSACAVISGLTGFDRGECETQPCTGPQSGSDAHDDGTVQGNADADTLDDAETGVVTDPTVEPFACGDFVCINGASCCAAYDGGPPKCAPSCAGGVRIECTRDSHCGEGRACCAQGTTTRDGTTVLDLFTCATRQSGCLYQVCNDPAQCVEEAGCAYSGGATGAPQYCVLRQ